MRSSLKKLKRFLLICNLWINKWMQSENIATLTEIRRHFHTLKGSGRMIGAKSSAELAWTVEDTLNRVINQSLQLTPTIQSYVQLVFKFYFLKLVDNLSKNEHIP
ncbi:Hpt domain-containing protein [Acinetobacter baumannii]